MSRTGNPLPTCRQWRQAARPRARTDDGPVEFGHTAGTTCAPSTRRDPMGLNVCSGAPFRALLRT